MVKPTPTAGHQLIEFNFPKPADLPAPDSANWFYFSWSGGVEVQMLVGYIDTAPYPGHAQNQQYRKLTPHIASRVFMSVRGFAILKANIDEAAARLKADGVPLDAIIAETLIQSPRPNK